MFAVLLGCGKKEIVKKEKDYTMGDLTFKIPSSFKEESNNSSMLAFSYSDKEMKNGCYLTVMSNDYYKQDLEEEVKGNIYSDGEPTIDTVSIGNKEWKLAKLTVSEKATYYSYAAVQNNKLYTMTYDDVGTGDYCNTAYNIIINSLKFK